MDDQQCCVGIIESEGRLRVYSKPIGVEYLEEFETKERNLDVVI